MSWRRVRRCGRRTAEVVLVEDNLQGGRKCVASSRDEGLAGLRGTWACLAWVVEHDEAREQAQRGEHGDDLVVERRHRAMWGVLVRFYEGGVPSKQAKGNKQASGGAEEAASRRPGGRGGSVFDEEDGAHAYKEILNRGFEGFRVLKRPRDPCSAGSII